MGITAAPLEQKEQSRAPGSWLVWLAVGVGFFLRLKLAWTTFLNPDEALHYFLAHQPSPRLAYEASLTTAHPPLMILFLHFWSLLGSSELYLRLPFVLAGVVSSWVMFLWVETVASRRAAHFALVMFLFAPSLVSVQAEIRQYSFLLLFSACCLYFLERAVKENSLPSMALSAVFLDLALLTHYSALIFAASAGAYAILLLAGQRPKPEVAVAWIGGQASALAISVFLFETQVAKLRQSGFAGEIAATWLRRSVFHPGEDRVLGFAWTNTLHLFRYFFSQGTVGVAGLLLFLFSLVAIIRSKRDSTGSARSLALLLLLPFAITLATAIAGIYPYGGSRHDVLLAMFAIPGVAIGLDRLRIGKVEAAWSKPALVAAGLVLSNLAPSPIGPYIRPRNQRRELIEQAVGSLRSLPPGSIVLTDAQGAAVLNYYFCPEPMALPFGRGAASLLKLPCGEDYVLVAPHSEAGLDRERFPDLLAAASRAAPDARWVDLFESGWIDDQEAEWLDQLRALGGAPENFGPNILLCRIPLAASGQPSESRNTVGFNDRRRQVPAQPQKHTV